jgi:hypothetical protein
VSNYIATILWGDGSFSIGTITPDPNLPGIFDVTGSKARRARPALERHGTPGRSEER